MRNFNYLNYKINKVIHKVTYSNISSNVLKKDIQEIKNNPNILFIYDKNINRSIVKKIKKSLNSLKNKNFTIEVSGGKENKDKELLFRIINFMSKKEFTKNSIILSMGGGVVGDVASFAAAIYMRGVYYFHIPSTMTSIFDSCIGGKTAINYHNKINLLGTYYHPYRVYLFHDIIKTTPEREYYSGFSEAIKCGIIGEKKILKILNKNYSEIENRNFGLLKILCKLVLKTKIYYFLNDVREKNKRLILNFGHTFAHAIEMAGSLKNKYQINHGEAVAIGMICEMKYAGVNEKYLQYIKDILATYNLPSKARLKKSKNYFLNRTYNYLFADKKRISKFPRYIKINKQFKPEIDELKNIKKIKKVLKQII
tara:strand:+ start:98 stop:1201 length:1104 start_codon:yes stop_codon:yes gene_type:complete